jgi:hypothetical protein
VLLVVRVGLFAHKRLHCLEALLLELVMLHEFVGATVVGVAFVGDVLADLVEALLYVQIERKQLFDDVCVDLRILRVQLQFRTQRQV